VDWNAIAKLSQEAFREAVNEWIGKARIQGGQVQAAEAILTPGSLKSDVPLDALMLQKLSRSQVPAPVARAIATVLAAAWNDWAAGFQIRLPGAYPSFVAVPGPVAPPTPAAVRVSLARGSSSGEMSLKTPLLAGKLASSLKTHAAAIKAGSPDPAMTSLARWVDTSFQEWKGIVTFGGSVGKGPVPTFAPPYVPVGPVIMGDNLSAGPVFVGPRFGKLTL